MNPRRWNFTLEELLKYNGSDSDKPILLALKGDVFDVSAVDFYKPDGPYSKLAGRDASRALGRMDLSEEAITSSNLSDLTPE